VDRHSLDPCRDLRALQEAAGWMDSAALVPLVDSRFQVIVRRGKSGLTTEWGGGLVLAGNSP
jgi:hypothetical protein